jgi:uridine phosphorylase
MPFPNHPDKYRSEPVITPEKSTDYARSVADGPAADPPDAVILCYSRSLLEYFVETYGGREIDRYYGDLYVFEETDFEVGVLGNFGIGAPTTAMVMEDLIADGAEAFLSVGWAGCLDESVAMGEFVVCEGAIRDEGTSHHYVEAEKYARPSESVVATIRRALREREEPFHVGPSWTTDAVYQETRAEVERYADEGVLTVEMEAATVFTVAAYRGVEAGAMFVVSDYLGPSEWDPNFHLAEDDLRRLGDAAKAVLVDHRE